MATMYRVVMLKRTRVNRMGRVGLLLCVLFANFACATQSLRYASWRYVETAHFEIFSALTPEETELAAADLEVFRRSVGFVAERPLPPPPSRIRVFAFDGLGLMGPFDRRTVTGYLATSIAGPAVVLRGGGGFRGDATLELRRDLSQLLLGGTVSSGRPLWYDAGLSEVLATLRIDDESVIVGMPRKALLRLTRDRPWTPIDTIIRTRDLVDHGKRAREEYRAETWLLSHYLLLGTQNRDSVRVWLGRMLQDQLGDPSEAIAGLGGGRPIDSVIQDYRKRARYPSISLRIEAPKQGTVRKSRRLDANEVAIELGALALTLGRSSRARGYFEDVLAETPGHIEAQAGLAVAEGMDGRFDEPGLAEDAAFATPEVPARALRWAAHARLLEAEQAEDAELRSALAESVRIYARRAQERLPSLSGPAALFTASFALEGEDAETGLIVAERAAKQMPGSSEIQLIHARILARLGRVASARGIAAAVVSRAVEHSVQREAEELIDGLGVTRLH